MTGFPADHEGALLRPYGRRLLGIGAPSELVFTIHRPLHLLLRPTPLLELTSRRPAVQLGFPTLSRNLERYTWSLSHVSASHRHQTQSRPRPDLLCFEAGEPNIWLLAAFVCLLTRLALQWILVKGFRLFSFQLPDLKKPGIVIYCHYLPVSGLGNLRACCLPWMW